jgi:predicted glycosyltransferase
MRILIALNHPAHYFLFKFIISGLKSHGHKVDIVIKEKDILEKILISEGQEYTKINEKKQRKNNPFSVLSKGLLELIIQNINLYKFVRKKSRRPDFMLGTDISIAHVGRCFGITSFIYNEDDFEINKLFCKATYPFAKYIVSPEYTSVGKFESKKVGYNGIQKMSYLNPKYFTPDVNVLKELGINFKEPFFIIRLVSLTSGHDIEGKHKGIGNDLLMKIIDFLNPRGKVFITSEDFLTEELSKYQLKIKPNQMHDIMAYATLFIGDSQSMCAESGILGTPFIRYNDFVGKIQYLNDLENKYKMGWGVKTDKPERIFSIIEELFKMDNVKEVWLEKRKSLFEEKIDLNALTIWMIENYPDSIQILQENKNYQINFK